MKKIPAVQIHKDATIIDLVCPLLSNKQHIDAYIKGGVTIVGPTVAINENCTESMKKIGGWYQFIQQKNKKLILIQQVKDIQQAKAANQLGVIFHFQNTLPFERDLNLIEVYYRLGVRVVQLSYNVRNFIGDGCEEPSDAGLSRFGHKVIQEMNRVGMVIDLAHTGHKTTLETIHASREPVIISHANAKAVCESARNVSDDIIKAIGKKQGVIGINAYPPFVSERKQIAVEDLLDHVDHIANLIGTDYISLGLDYFTGQVPYMSNEQAKANYDAFVKSGSWNPKTYPPPPYKYPERIETPNKLKNLTEALVTRGYSSKDIKKILGENLIRIFKKVWK